MSKILLAVSEGKATKEQMIYKGEVRWIVKYNGSYYYRSIRAQRYFKIKKTDVSPVLTNDDKVTA